MTNEPALQALVERVNAARANGTPLAIEGGGTKFVCAFGSGAAILSEDHDGVIYSTAVILVSLRPSVTS